MKITGITRNGFEFDLGRDVLDLSTVKGANRAPSTMGYKFLIGIKGPTVYHVMFEGRVPASALEGLRKFDVVLGP